MKKTVKAVLITLFFISRIYPSSFSQADRWNDSLDSPIISATRLEILLNKPYCLEDYRPNQSGPLSRIDKSGGKQTDSTFTVEKIKIPSDGLLINGYLYLPLGEDKCPLIVLTNGGGDDSRPIRSLSDWIAPILAHCGIAAFVHDKRGTGESGGNFTETTYDDYVQDAGNCAVYLAGHSRIDPGLIGVMGGSEGGRIAVLTASRFPRVAFVISFAGTMVSTQDDRLYATLGGLKSNGISDSLIETVKPLWIESFAAWADDDPVKHEKVNAEIIAWRQKYDKEILPSTKEEMDSIESFRAALPTWYSMPNDYLSELKYFTKKWLAVFGELDQVVPTKESIKNILYYMSISGSENFNIAVLPKCGHSPVNVETRRMVRLDNLIINWLYQNVINQGHL